MRQLNGLMFVCMVTAKQLMSRAFSHSMFLTLDSLPGGSGSRQLELQQEGQPLAAGWSSPLVALLEQRESSENGARMYAALDSQTPGVVAECPECQDSGDVQAA